jgi:hypothetical protein
MLFWGSVAHVLSPERFAFSDLYSQSVWCIGHVFPYGVASPSHTYTHYSPPPTRSSGRAFGRCPCACLAPCGLPCGPCPLGALRRDRTASRPCCGTSQPGCQGPLSEVRALSTVPSIAGCMSCTACLRAACRAGVCAQCLSVSCIFVSFLLSPSSHICWGSVVFFWCGVAWYNLSGVPKATATLRRLVSASGSLSMALVLAYTLLTSSETSPSLSAGEWGTTMPVCT